jgi:hypothetical protein
VATEAEAAEGNDPGHSCELCGRAREQQQSAR